ncbi:Kae1-associated kinase Bud32 [Methanophagales archaeon]|nr:MAG: Kae1-associated kinase Bud32 [Methanophagales archaeon]RJS86464.1 MAG: Kae1-associated kinase Bud32 [Methanophagales archaeon]
MIQCAEAIVEIKGDLVYKRRVQKRYRVKEIDERIRRERTKSEAKLISEARRKGVPTPIIFDISDYELVMERIEGDLAREVIDEDISKRIGEFVGILHKNGIIHGDLTTSNIIVSRDNAIYFIDFGLSFIESSTEARGVDVHVFFQSICGTYESYEGLKESFIEGYKRTFSGASQVLRRVKEIEQRGRYVERK